MTNLYLLSVALMWLAGFLWSIKVSRLQVQAQRAERAKAREQREAQTKACEREALLTYARAGVGVGEAMLRLGLVPASEAELRAAYLSFQAEQARLLAQSPHVTQVQGVTILPLWLHRGGSA